MMRIAELSQVADWQRQRLTRWWRRASPAIDLDASFRQAVEAADNDADALSRTLVDYLWRTHLHYRVPDGTLAYYPGHASIYGATNDAIEGVTRLMPLWAAYATSPWADADYAQAMQESLRETLRQATNPQYEGYWGNIGDRSTLICEAADVALALWLGREWLWPTLPTSLQNQVLRWLRQALGKRTADNNWHLFVVVVDAVLERLDPEHRFSSTERLARVHSFATASGCYYDGPNGTVDLYNAWAFHYSLFWLGEMGIEAPTPALSEFCRWFQWLFTPDGLPLFGRSLCYRHAACAPLLLCAVRDATVVTQGVALAAFLANWRSFTTRGGIRAGRPTQGVFGEDVRWLDPYSGPASSLWGTRSLVAYFYTGRRVDWNRLPPEALPATCQSICIDVPGLNATIETDAPKQRSCVVFNRAAFTERPPLQVTGMRDRLRELLLGVASRPTNNLQKAGLARFCSSLDVYQ